MVNKDNMKKDNKKRVYVLMLSKEFPKEHPKAGEPTGFVDLLKVAFSSCETCRKTSVTNCSICVRSSNIPIGKIHTIRKNYERWEKRIKAVQEGKAMLSIRQWKGRPYEKGNVQIEIVRLGKDDGVGIQKLEWDQMLGWFIDSVDSDVTTADLARNDGLSFEDWKEWFKDMDFTEPLPIIHFTKFRYGKQE